MKIILLFLGICLLTASCSTTEIKKEVQIPRAVPGTMIPIEEFHRVRYGENIKTFTLNRYIDPANPDIMYERSVMYRVEQTPAWNTLPAKPFTLQSDRKIQYIDVTAQRQMAEMEMGLRAQKKIMKGMNILTKSSIKSFKSLFRENVKLSNEITHLKKDVENLNQKIKTNQTKKTKEVPKIKSKPKKIDDITNF